MAATSYTLLEIAKTVSHRAGFIKTNIETLANPDDVVNDLVESINEVMRSMWRVKPFPEMNGLHLFATEDTYSTGGVTIVAGATAVTGVGTTWGAAGEYANGLMVMTEAAVGGLGTPVRWVAHGGNTAATLAEAWPFASVADKDYNLGLDRYPLPADFGDFISASVSGPAVNTLKYLTPEDMARQRHTRRSAPFTEGQPLYVTVFDVASNTWMCELDPIPDDVYGITIKYKKTLTRLTADADVVPIPDEHISTLTSGTLALMRAHHAGPEMAAAYEVWKKTELMEFATFGNKRTDPSPQIIPSDNMRGLDTSMRV